MAQHSDAHAIVPLPAACTKNKLGSGLAVLVGERVIDALVIVLRVHQGSVALQEEQCGFHQGGRRLLLHDG